MNDVFAFDTETAKGKAILITYAVWSGFDPKHGHEADTYSREPKSKKDIVRFLANMAKDHNTGWCFNIDYDVCALLKWFSYDEITKIYLGETVKLDRNLSVSYIPRKCFTVEFLDKDEKGNLHTYICKIFDLYQYYVSSLNNASKKYLKEKKKDLPKKIITNLHLKTVYKKNRRKIIEYAEKDAWLTWMLAERFMRMLKESGVNVKTFYSGGSIAMRHIKKFVKIPQIHDEKIKEFVKRGYFGGRVEFINRGKMKNISLYDINSAYPYAISRLKRIKKLRFENQISKNADYFFVECDFELYGNIKISPFAYRDKIVKYPFGKFENIVLDNYTFNNCKPYFKNLKIKTVLNVYCKKNDFLFKKIVHKLYAERQKGEAQNYIYKLILNAFYGKLAQKDRSLLKLDEKQTLNLLTKNYRKDGGKRFFEKYIKKICPSCYKKGNVQKECKSYCCITYRKRYSNYLKKFSIVQTNEGFYQDKKQNSNFSNIIYASLITAYIRNMMFEVAKETGFKNIVGFMTDCIFSKKPIPKKYIDKNKKIKTLGKFSLKTKSWLYVIGTGIYQHKYESKFRGYSLKKSLIEIVKKGKKKNIIGIKSIQRIGLGQTLLHWNEIKDFNILKDTEKRMDLNFDSKRNWEQLFSTFGESLRKEITSKPLFINGNTEK